MPKIVLPVPDTLESVMRPVVLDITRQLYKILGIPENTVIYFPGDVDTTYQPNSTITPASDTNIMATSGKIVVEVEENYEADRMLSTAVYRPENLFIFRDDRIETSIKPAYSTTEVTLNFRYRAVDHHAANRWRDDIRARVSMNRAERIHDLTYHYLIPKEFLVILQELYRMREAVAPYGESFDTFFQDNLTERASVATNQSGTQQEWVIAEKQLRVLGWFDFEGIPEAGSKDDSNNDTWTIGFAYKFKYDKPLACVMQYPLVIHNQVVSQDYRPSEKPEQLELHQANYSLSAKNFSMFEKSREIMTVASLPGVAIPDYDEFLPRSIVHDTLRVFTCLVTLDATDPPLLLSLRTLCPSWQLDADILDYLTGEIAYLPHRYQSAFTLSLYESCDLMDESWLTVDADLNVYAKQALSLRMYYHVRLGLLKDLSLLDEAAKTRLRNHGPALVKILDALDSTLRAKGKLPPMTANGYVKRADFETAIDEINRAILSKGDRQIRQFNTVETLMIEAAPMVNNYAYR